MESLETVVSLKSYLPPGVLGGLPGGLIIGSRVIWGILDPGKGAEIEGDESELLRVGTTCYHPCTPVPRIGPSPNKYLQNAQSSKGKGT